MKHHEEANKANAREDAITATRACIVELARGITTNHELSAEVAKLEQLECQS